MIRPHPTGEPVPDVRLLRDGSPVASADGAIAEAARLLRSGEVVAIPTDTVYGLAAALDAPDALTAIYRIKGRARDQPLPVLMDDATTVDRLVADAAGRSPGRPVDWLLRLANDHWPGALTVAVPARPGLAPAVVAGDGTVGLRVPDHQVARRVIRLAGGALAVTSANRSGQPPATDAGSISAHFGEPGTGPVWVLDAGPATGGRASTVIGSSGDALVIHRAGAVDPGDLRRSWAALQRAGTGADG